MRRRMLPCCVALFLLAMASHAAEPPAIAGKVVDSAGNPVPGAKIYLGLRPPTITTDATGSFTMPAPSLDDDFTHAAMTDDKRLGGVTLVAAGSTTVTIKMQPTAAYDGQVLTTDGRPASGLSFSIGMSFGHGLAKFQELNADADGRFKAQNLIPGARYSAFWSGGSETNRDYSFGNVSFDLSRLKPGQPITFRARQYLNTLIGKVVNEKGQPVPEAKLDVVPSALQPQELSDSRQPVPIDQNGQFTIQRLAPGLLKLHISANTYRPATFHAPADSIEFKAILRPADAPLQFRVSVVDENQQPLKAANVVLQTKTYGAGQKDAAISTRYETDDNGRLTIEPPPREKSRGRMLLIYCDTPGRDFACYSAHEDADEEIRLPAPKSTQHWRGKLIDSTSKPVPGATVQLKSVPSCGLPDDLTSTHLGIANFADEIAASVGLRQTTDNQGQFELTRLGSMQIEFRATAPGYGPLDGSFTSHRDNITDQKVFTILPPAVLKGRLVLKSTRHPPAQKAFGRISFTTSGYGAPVADINIAPDWTFSTDQLPVGSYRVRVTFYGNELRQYLCQPLDKITLQGNKTTETVLEIDQTTAIQGKLVHAKTGKPLRGEVTASPPDRRLRPLSAPVREDGSWELNVRCNTEYTLFYYVLVDPNATFRPPDRQFKTITVEPGRPVNGLIIQADPD